jgi:hypothetical protein
MWRSVAFITTDVSEAHIATILHSVLQLLVTANIAICSLILFTLMMKAICSSDRFLQEPQGVLPRREHSSYVQKTSGSGLRPTAAEEFQCRLVLLRDVILAFRGVTMSSDASQLCNFGV